ncbi:MAG: 50S ribosomal protein L23 [Eubacterium sp.]|nr:50S ribosomal protein L23 [Eubacterium sp.]
MKNPRDIIVRPIITERSMDDSALNKYTFEVAKTANKIEIKEAVETIFDVKVEKVATMNMNGKMKRMGRFEGRRKNWKKAIVKLTADSKAIEFFEGV